MAATDAGDDGRWTAPRGRPSAVGAGDAAGSPNSVVSTDALVDGLWGDSPPSAARHTVQGYVSELRKLLGPVIEREGPGYVVRVDELVAGLVRVRGPDRATAGRSSPRIPERPQRRCGLRLRLWRGPPFSGLDDAGVLLAERTRLEELQLLALEDRVAADLALGSPPRGRRRARRAESRAPVSRGAAGPAHAGVVPIGPPGRGVAGVPTDAGGAGRRAGDRAVAAAAPAGGADPRAGPGARSGFGGGRVTVRPERAGRATRTWVCARSPKPTPTTSTAATS